MPINIYVYIHINIYVHTHINICIYTLIYVCVYIHTLIYNNTLQLFELRFRGFKGLLKIILQCQRLDFFWIEACLILGLIFNGEIWALQQRWGRTFGEHSTKPPFPPVVSHTVD